MKTLSLILAALLVSAVAASAQTNLFTNADLTADADGDGLPDRWQAAGDAQSVTQKLTLDTGPEGRRALKLTCTALEMRNASSHAMICQVGQLAVTQGQWYRVTFRAKQQGLDEVPLSVALSNMQGWSNLGLSDSFVATDQWQQYEFAFRATGTAQESTRFQIWYTCPGTLCLTDLSCVAAPAEFHPTLVWPAAASPNRVPNGNFALGAVGWGSSARFAGPGWPPALNRLVGEVVAEPSPVGGQWLHLDLDPAKLPVSCYDYFQMSRAPIAQLYTGLIGWIETTPGEKYVLSAYLRTDRDDVPLSLGVNVFGGGTLTSAIRVGRAPARYQCVFTARARWSSPVVTVDLAQVGQPPTQLWLTGVQLEPGAQPTAYAPRQPVEAGLSTDRDGNIFFIGQKVVVNLTAANTAPTAAPVSLQVTDFDDQPVATKTLTVPPASPAFRQAVDLGLTRTGFYRVQVTVNGEAQPRPLRLALIKQHSRPDSLFGVNHAYPYDHLQREIAAAGIKWVRDWSLKWQDVQPQEGGPFDFSGTDFQIGRPLSNGQQVLGLLPFPSANWSSSAPPEVKVGPNYPANRERQAYAPRSEAEFTKYVSETIKHYQGRLRWWQCFNEPIYTDYSLPQAKGYTSADYARWVKAFYQAAKATDPRAQVLMGISCWPSTGERYFRDLFAAGALDYCDAVDLHTYPGLSTPESTEQGLVNVNRLMQERGKVKPLWLTEHGYYGDDDPDTLPVRHGGFDVPLPSERVQAAYAMRFNVILLAHGVERIFYHAGGSIGLNADAREPIFFEYGGAPRRIYAALAAFADLFQPGVKPLGELNWGPRTKAYLFRQGPQLLVAAWLRSGSQPLTVTWTSKQLTARDLMGNPPPGRKVPLSAMPTFFVADGVTPEALAKALQRSR